MKKLIQILPFIVIVALSAILLVKLYSGRTEIAVSSEDKKIGRKMPDMYLQDILSENGKLKPADFLGKYTVLNFFSSWCTTCKLEHPIFMELAKTGKFQIIGVAWRDKKKDTLAWLADMGNPFDKVGYDNLGKYGISSGITGIPETFVVDKDGIIIIHYRGDIKPEFLLELQKISKISFLKNEKVQKKDTN